VRGSGASRPLLSVSSRRAFGFALACAAGVIFARADSLKTVFVAIGALLVPALLCARRDFGPPFVAAGGGSRCPTTTARGPGPALARVAVVLAFCAAGWGGAALEIHRDPAPPLLAAWARRGFAEQRTPVVVRGIVIDLERPDSDRVVLVLRTIAPLPETTAAERFRLPEGFGVRLTVPVLPDEGVPWEIGDRLETTARLGPPRSWRNPGGFDYAAALRTRGVSLSGSIKSPRLVELVGREPAWRLAGPRLRRRLVTALEAAAPERRATADFLLALLLGERQAIDPDLEDRLKRAGVYHILALSGFNVALVAGAAGWVLRLVVQRPHRRRVAIVLVLAVYGLVARPGGSILRATLMGTALLVGRQAGRSGAAAASLATSATVLLLLRPAWLADPGFQLSYAATLGLLFGVRPAQAARGTVGSGRAPAVRALAWLANQAGTSFRVSASALAATAPLTARHFQSVTLAGLVANVIAVPLASVGLLVALVAAPLAIVWPTGAAALVALASPLVAGLDRSAAIAAGLPAASFFIQPPSWGMAALLMMLLGAAALSRRSLPRRLLFALAAVAALLLAGRGRDPKPPGRLDFVVFDVGQGDALLVRTPQGRTLLVDAGGLARGDFDVGARVVAPALRALGVLRLDLLVVTHPHQDHLGGAPAIVRLFRPEAVWIGASGFDDPRLGALEKAAEESGARLLLPRRGLVTHFGGVRLEVLNPAPSREARARAGRSGRSGNDQSLVLRLRFGRRSLLLTGDMEGPAESSLLAEGRPVAADLLKVAHHGSDTSTGEPFLAAVAPGTAVVSVGLFNSWGHPSPRVLQRLETKGVRLFRTDRDGAVRARTDGLAPWRLQRLGEEENAEDFGGHRKEGQQEQHQPEDGDGGAPGAERLDRIERTRMTQADEPEEHPEHDEVGPAGQETEEDENRGAEAGDDPVHARRNRIQHVAAVELADRQQVQGGREQPEPGGDEEGMQVDRGPLRRIEEQRIQQRQEQAGREADLPGRGRRVRRRRQREAEGEDREEGHEPRDRSGDSDVEERPARREGSPDADDGSEGPEEIHAGKEVGEGRVDPIEATGDVVPHLVAPEDEQRGQRIRKPGGPRGGMPEDPRQEGQRERSVTCEHRPDEGGRAKRHQEEPGVEPRRRALPDPQTGESLGRRPDFEAIRNGTVVQWNYLRLRRFFPGLNRIVLPGGMRTSVPVRGFRPIPFLRGLTWNTPKPRSSMRSPRRIDSFMASRIASTATTARTRVISAVRATLLMMSLLITPPPPSPPRPARLAGV